MSNERDPRRDPRPKDCVKKGQRTRRVDWRNGGEVSYTEGKTGRKRSCWITTWQDWCNGAEVLHVAE